MNTRLLILAGFVTALYAPSGLRAQAVGEILGTVTDQSGAVVPNVKITAVQTATSVTRNTVASAQGTYTLAQLPGGQLRRHGRSARV